MEIDMKKTVQVQAKTLKIHLKVSDRFCASIHDQDGVELGGQSDGYVPSFMPGDHYGDYVILDIDLDTGMVTNWKKPHKDDIQKFISQNEENH